MHEHVVLVKLHDPGAADLVVERMRSMAGRIPGLLTLDAHRNEIDADFSFDVMLRTRFESRGAYDAYTTDPLHAEVAAFVKSKMITAATCDHEVAP